jgi:methyl-coenzyme M reductase gamma subunit
MAEYKTQYYPGAGKIAENRRNFMNPEHELEKQREVPDEDVALILGHRAPGEAYKSVHPPLEEMEEPDCAIRELVEPTEGAKAGDRIRYAQFTDSVYFAPSTPYARAWMMHNRYRGIDTGTLSGRWITEARERDIEKIAGDLLRTEVYDPALSSMRGATVHGHSLRLLENGLMFDMLRRTELGEDGNVYYIKNQIGEPLDKKISVGKPLPEEVRREKTTSHRVDGYKMRDDEELLKFVQRIHKMRAMAAYQLKIEE